MLLPELVEHVGRIEARVVAQLARDDLQCFCVRVDEELRLARYAARVVAQVAADLHVDGAPARHHRLVLDGAPHNHDGIVKAALSLRNELHMHTKG